MGDAWAGVGDAGAGVGVAGAGVGDAGAGPGRRPAASGSIRSTERRRWSADLVGPATAGLVLHGVGGIGKSVLAAEITARVGRLQPERVATILSGEICADRFLAGLTAALRRAPVAASWRGDRAAAVAAAGQAALPWDHRMALLREHVLGEVPVLVVLDDFDDNLTAESGGRTVADPALAALLADWAEVPQLGRLLITCRHPFTLPGSAGRALGWRRLGPLSRSGAVKLAASLPALGRLGEQEFDRAWRLLGGHPRAMEYLDVLLGTGQAQFPDLARRLRAAVQARTGSPVARTGPDAPTGLPSSTAEAVALAAADLLLGDLWRSLGDAARDLLTGVSVYREPVGWHALLLPGGAPGRFAGLAAAAAECEIAESTGPGLLAGDGRRGPAAPFADRSAVGEQPGRFAGLAAGAAECEIAECAGPGLLAGDGRCAPAAPFADRSAVGEQPGRFAGLAAAAAECEAAGLLAGDGRRAPAASFADRSAVGEQPGRLAGLAAAAAECEAVGLLAVDRRCEPPALFVHRWTASELHRRLAGEGRDAEVADAHRRAADYWRQRVTASPQDRHALREAGYHRFRAGGLSGPEPGPQRPAPARMASPWRRRLLGLAVVGAAPEPGPQRPAPARMASPWRRRLLGLAVVGAAPEPGPQRRASTRMASPGGRLTRGTGRSRASRYEVRAADPEGRLRRGTRSARASRNEWRTAGPGRPRLPVLVAIAVTVTAFVTAWAYIAFSAPHAGGPAPGARPAGAATLASRLVAVRDQAAAWVAQQVSGGAIVACDPAMCAALQAHGIAPANLLVLRPSAPDPLGSDVVLATAAVRSQFGARLASVYAPTVIASFGDGALRIDVRAAAPDGAAAYRASLAADLAARREAGRQLLRNPRISIPPAARADLVTGRVDPRLLITLAALAAAEPVRITAFTDSGPRAGPGVPLRAMRIAVPTRAAGGPATGDPAAGDPAAGRPAGDRPAGDRPADSTAARRILAFVRAQRPPYRPAQAGLLPGPRGAPVLSIEFAAPSPVGLLETQPPP